MEQKVELLAHILQKRTSLGHELNKSCLNSFYLTDPRFLFKNRPLDLENFVQSVQRDASSWLNRTKNEQHDCIRFNKCNVKKM